MTIETKKVASVNEAIAIIDRLNYRHDTFQYRFTTREDNADIKYRHFDAYRDNGEKDSFAMIEIVVNGKLEVVRFFNLFRDITVDLKLGDFTPDYSRFDNVIDVDAENATVEEVSEENKGSEDDDYDETDEPEILNADLFVNLYHSPIQERYASVTRTINGEQLHFFHHRLTHISAPALNLEVYFDNGRMNFWHGFKRIPRDKVWQVPIIKETAKAQTESFGKFFAGDHTPKFFRVSVYPTFADGSEHNYVRYFDFFNQAQKFVEEVKTFVGDVPNQIYITHDGNYFFTRINGTEHYTLPAVDATEAQSRLDELNKAIADNESFADKCDDDLTASKLRVANSRLKRSIAYYEAALRMTEPTSVESRPAFEDGKVYILHARDRIGRPTTQLHKVKRVKMFGKNFLAVFDYIKWLNKFSDDAERYQIRTTNEGEYIEDVYAYSDGCCHRLFAKDLTDDPTIAPPVDTQTDKPTDFTTKLAELKAEADAAKVAEQKAADALDEAQKIYDKARSTTCEANYAISRLYRAKANELKNELFALPKVKIELKTTCGEKFIASHTWGISTLGNKFSLLDMAHGAHLATYDTPEEVTDVITRLKAAIARGDKEFIKYARRIPPCGEEPRPSFKIDSPEGERA